MNIVGYTRTPEQTRQLREKRMLKRIKKKKPTKREEIMERGAEKVFNLVLRGLGGAE